jgi:hypothetical protein
MAKIVQFNIDQPGEYALYRDSPEIETLDLGLKFRALTAVIDQDLLIGTAIKALMSRSRMKVDALAEIT